MRKPVTFPDDFKMRFSEQVLETLRQQKNYMRIMIEIQKKTSSFTRQQ